MSQKRKVNFSDDDDNESIRAQTVKRVEQLTTETEARHDVRAKGKHSLDSDEEDVAEDESALKLDDIEGQEESKVDIEDGIRFTPFNLREEYEEGEFDADGMYLFKKNKNQIKDNWIDDIDWAKVKQLEKSRPGNLSTAESEEPTEVLDVIAIYQTMVKLMQPGETVARAIKRLGGAKSGTSAVPVRRNRQAWKNKRARMAEKMDDSTSGDATSESAASDGPSGNAAAKRPNSSELGKEELMELIGYADKLLTENGEMEVYQETYEGLNYKIKTGSKTSTSASAIDSGLDMFADEAATSKPTDVDTDISSASLTKVSETADKPSSQSEVTWQYKLENTDTAEICGPFSSSEMLRWVEDNRFPDGVFVRKFSAAPDGPFYSSQRIDFELYV